MSALEEALLEHEVPSELEVYQRTFGENDLGAWLQIFTGGVIQTGEWSTISMADYNRWLDLAGIPREFADDPDVRKMHDERRLPPVIAHHEFFFLLTKVAPRP